MNTPRATSAPGSEMQELTGKFTEFSDDLILNKGQKCTEEVEKSGSAFVLKIHELPSTLILHQNMPKLLTSVNATYTEACRKALTSEPFQ